MGCYQCKNIRAKKPEISSFAKRIVKYYIFHLKLETIFGANKKLIKTEQKNEIKINEFYILDYNWVDFWRAYAEYNEIKENLDKVDYINNLDMIKHLQTKCQEEVNRLKLKEFTNPLDNNENSYNKFIHNNQLKLEDFDYLVDKETFKLFKEIKFSNYFKKHLSFEGFFSDQIIILFLEQLHIVKFLYRGLVEVKEELIQLTANCLNINEKTNEFDLKSSELKYNALKKFLLSKTDEQIINLFNSNNINFLQEIFIKIDSFNIKIRNENLYSKYLNKETIIKNNINFTNGNKIKLIGLDNVGATCYMNATLQCFLNIKSLTDYLLNENIFNRINQDNYFFIISRAFCNLLNKVWLDDTITSHYAPEEFKRIISNKNPLFEGVNANDSKDLINFMLEEIHLELINLNEINKIDYKKNLFKDDQINMELTLENFRNDFSKKNNSIIAKTFFFMLQSTTMCKKCGITKYNFQVLFILEFQLKEIYNHNSRLNKPLINSRGKKFVDIFSCFDYNSQPSDFTGENQLFCTKCNSLTDSISSNNIFSLSPVLIIILDRGKDKNFECDVDFPEYLNLQNYVAYQKSIYNYQLRGVITHLGESGMSGHFIAFCRH